MAVSANELLRPLRNERLRRLQLFQGMGEPIVELSPKSLVLDHKNKRILMPMDELIKLVESVLKGD